MSRNPTEQSGSFKERSFTSNDSHDQSTSSSEALVRVIAKEPNCETLVREYSKPDIVQSCPLIELALGTYVDRDCDSLVHVIESGRYKDQEKEYVILTDVPPSYYITILDNIAAAVKLPDLQVAPFKSNLSFFEMAMFLRASRYLGVEKIESYMRDKMNVAVESLLSRTDVKAVYANFPAGTLPRHLAVVSIAEHCLALVEYGNADEKAVWRHVFIQKYGGIPELEGETVRYYNHMLAVRRAKKHMVRQQSHETVQRLRGNGRGVGGRHVPGAD